MPMMSTDGCMLYCTWQSPMQRRTTLPNNLQAAPCVDSLRPNLCTQLYVSPLPTAPLRTCR